MAQEEKRYVAFCSRPTTIERSFGLGRPRGRFLTSNRGTVHACSLCILHQLATSRDVLVWRWDSRNVFYRIDLDVMGLPTTFMLRVSVSSVPECVVAGCWKRIFRLPRHQEQCYWLYLSCYTAPAYLVADRFSESRVSIHKDNVRFYQYWYLYVYLAICWRYCREAGVCWR